MIYTTNEKVSYEEQEEIRAGGSTAEVGDKGQRTDFKKSEKTKVKGYKKMKCLSITTP